MLFDRLRVEARVPGASNAILIIGGAGGGGSVAIQLLRAFTDLTVIATASMTLLLTVHGGPSGLRFGTRFSVIK